MKQQNSLYEEMKKFRSEKKLYSIVLLVLGVIGLVLPIIPGFLFIGLGLALLYPKQGTELLERIKRWFRSIFSIF
ncbi:MAG: hypothetical protein ACOY90_03185 [Candidatus Zhuqueibacterota bacterium]